MSTVEKQAEESAEEMEGVPCNGILEMYWRQAIVSSSIDFCHPLVAGWPDWL